MMKFTGRVVAHDASRFTHGAVYHALFDRPLAEARRLVVNLVPERSHVLDIACGTGELCFQLVARKDCRVVGIDLSRRMIAFAQRRNPNDAVCFIHGDATALAGHKPDAFDYATILFLLHELPRQEQHAVLNEALRVARNTIIIDSLVPLPWNFHGIALRVVEAMGGPEHYRSFANYLAAGGIDSILNDPGIRVSVAQRSVFWHGCREMVVLRAQK